MLGDTKGLDWSQVARDVQSGYIKAIDHETENLRIYNYTPKAQFDDYWTPETRACRGLIVDGYHRIIARPFEKFFNYDEHSQLPNEPFHAYQKLDGSLGVLYWNKGKPCIATRGSFVSEQAQWATSALREIYKDADLRENLTYLFEIVYPENRIIVDYGSREELVLLGIIETETAVELPLRQDIGFPVSRHYEEFSQWDDVLATEIANEEGFVIRFESGLRVKVKFSEYKRLHKLLTGLSSKSIWEYLSKGDNLADIIDRTPDEFMKWVNGIAMSLSNSYDDIENTSRFQMKMFDSRKETAIYFNTCDYPSVMFKMLDGKDYSETIWKLIKPSGSRLFVKEREDESI